LSQRGLAELAGVSHSYVTKLEGGDIRNPSVEKMERIAAALRWPDYHAMLSGEELEPPRRVSDKAEPPPDLREWQAAQTEFLSEMYSLLLGVRRDVRTLVERTGRAGAGGPPPATSRP
jgi:transcriptional regulator with XRE-family HTH domain